MGKNKYGSIAEGELKNELNNYVDGNNITIFPGNNNFVVVFEESGRCYEIDDTGNISGPEIIEIEETAGDITKGGEYDGTSTSPYKIACIEDLVAFSKAINNNEISTSCYVILTKTLDFKSIFSYGNYKAKYTYDETTNSYIEDETSNTTLMGLCTQNIGFIPIGNSTNNAFKGNFDGQGYEIQNIYINTTGNAGLFGVIFLPTIQNLGITGNITSIASYAGGLIAEGSLRKIENCYNKANVKGDGSTGGIVGHGGWQSKSMINCYNNGKIKSEKGLVGGLAGTFAGEVTNCYNLEDVISNKSYAAGIVGQSAGSITITNCYNSGNAEGGYAVAGIVAFLYSSTIVNNCYNTGDIVVKNAATSYSHANGIGATTATNCYNIGNLSSTRGCHLIGATTIDKCYYNSSLAINSEISEEEVIDISTKSKEEFVELLNSYTDENGKYPSGWKKWKTGNDDFPVFE